MRIATAVVICLLAITAAVVTGGVSPVAAGPLTDEGVSQTITIDIDEDGDARFIVIERHQLDSGDDREAFETLIDEFEDGEYDLRGPDYGTIISDVSETTDRQMSLVDTDRSGTIDDDTGTLEYAFTWTSFAVPTDDGLEVGDAFHIDDDVHWLGSLSDTQELVIVPPEEYLIASSSGTASAVDNGTLIWEGPTTFAVGDIQATFDTAEDSGTDLTVLAVGGILVIGAVLAFAWRYRERLVAALDTGEDADPPTDVVTESDGGVPSSPASPSDPDPEPDPELLSDPERVEWLLEENGGRMKQRTIVEETDWSSAKVSQLLSQMEDDGRIQKLRIGRENLIALPDENITESDL